MFSAVEDFSFLNQITSIEKIVRNYRTLFDWVKKTKKPLFVLRRNVPDVVVVDVGWLKNLEEKLNQAEEERILGMAKGAEKELKAGKAKVLTSLANLWEKTAPKKKN